MIPRTFSQALVMGLILIVGWWFLSSTINGIEMALRRMFWWMLP